MKASELRIGNYIIYAQNILSIASIDKKRVVLEYHNRPLDFSVTFLNQVNPIPLTKEWLLKFGFKHNANNQYRLKSRLIVIRDGVFTDYGSNVQLINVHQLQNFYFALIGEELTINEL